MKQDETFQQENDERVNWNWRDEVTVPKKQQHYRPNFLKLLQKLDGMCNCYLRRITIEKHCIDLAHNLVHPVQNALYRVRSKSGKFAAAKTDRKLREDSIEQVTTEWASPIVLATMKDSLL